MEPEKEKYIGIEEACELLETGEPEILDLVAKGKLHAFRIGDQYLRFRKDQVSDVKAKWRINQDLFPDERHLKTHRLSLGREGWTDRVRDFFYFNDFYVLCAGVIAALLYLIVSSQ